MTECPNPSWCEINSCNGNCKKDPYGVPTGYVPRAGAVTYVAKERDLNLSTLRPYPPDDPEHAAAALPDLGVSDSPNLTSVAEFLRMRQDSEILASVRAFIALHGKHGYVDVDTIRRLVHPAPDGADGPSVYSEQSADRAILDAQHRWNSRMAARPKTPNVGSNRPWPQQEQR